MREWTVVFISRKKSEDITVTVRFMAKDIHEAIETAFQYYGEELWEITDMNSYERLHVDTCNPA